MKRRASSRRHAAASPPAAAVADAADVDTANEQAAATSAPPPSEPRGRGVVTSQRALYFARGETAAVTPFATATAAASTSASASASNESSWPGYYATARDLGEQRLAAQVARQAQLDRAAAEASTPRAMWQPRTKKARTTVRTHDRVVPRLQELVLRCLATHIAVMPTLAYIDTNARHQVARAVVVQRRMKPDVLPLFIFPGVTEIDLPDCSMLDETTFLQALQECTAEGLVLAVLRLGLCGRCVSDSVIHELGDSLRSVEQLQLDGCYRISDTGMEALVRRCAPSLQTLSLSCNQRLTKSAIDYCGELKHLHTLSLSECPQLDDGSLTALHQMPLLRKLELQQMARISDEFVGSLSSKLPLLEELSLARCTQLTDAAVRAVLENCRQLHTLDVSDLHTITDASFEPVRDLGHALRSVSLQRCLELTDTAVTHIALGAQSFLVRLELSSVAEVTDAALLALQTHCRGSLQTLDVSFCRQITEDGLGIFTDDAESLTTLILWGCTQITARFLTCHARDELIIAGHPLLTGLTVKS